MAIDLATAVEDFGSRATHGEFFPRAYYNKLTSDHAMLPRTGSFPVQPTRPSWFICDMPSDATDVAHRG
jgi:hypothetical protein